MAVLQSSASRLERMGGLAVPDIQASSIFTVDFEALSNEFGRPPHIVSDLDHTLRCPSGRVADEVHDFVADQLAAGHIASFSPATNNPFGHRAPGVDKFAHVFRPYLTPKGLVRKPDTRYFEPIFDRLQAAPEHCVMIGNDVFTDVYGGNRVGMTTVQVEPIGAHYVFEFCKHHRGRRVARLGRRAADLIF